MGDCGVFASKSHAGPVAVQQELGEGMVDK
jgi:hypothetical protein